jgi:hypothetical protein
MKKTILVILCSISAWFIYGLGLVAPLTPSEGTPGPVELIVFLGLPLALFAWCWFLRSALWARILVLVQLVVIAVSGGWLLSLQSGLFR